MARTHVVSLLPPTGGCIQAPPLPLTPKRAEVRQALDQVERAYRAQRGPLPRRARVGCRVTLLERESMEQVALVVTQPEESEPERGRISCLSPLGRGLIGAEPGDVVDIALNNQSSRFYVLHVEPAPDKEAR